MNQHNQRTPSNKHYYNSILALNDAVSTGPIGRTARPLFPPHISAGPSERLRRVRGRARRHCRGAGAPSAGAPESANVGATAGRSGPHPGRGPDVRQSSPRLEVDHRYSRYSCSHIPGPRLLPPGSLLPPPPPLAAALRGRRRGPCPGGRLLRRRRGAAVSPLRGHLPPPLLPEEHLQLLPERGDLTRPCSRLR